MRRYAIEIGFSVPHEEEAEVWRRTRDAAHG
jgi:hypothetical protein